MHCHPKTHGHSALSMTDPRFESDEFTQAALSERRARVAHAHVGAFVASFLGALVVALLFRSIKRPPC